MLSLKKTTTKDMSDVVVPGLYRNSWLHLNRFTLSAPLPLLDKPK